MLEVWEAERFEEQKLSGRTRPLVIECRRTVPSLSSEIVADNPESSETVTRLMLVKSANSEIGARGMFSEVYGNLIARHFGVNTPQPALVNIGQSFVDAMGISDQTRDIPLAAGHGVGCEYLKGLAPVVPHASRNNEEDADVQAIYGVDLLTQNPDRRTDKPNCAAYRGGIFAFDFELTFSFLLPLIGSQPDPWAVDEQGIGRRHLFYDDLRTRQHELDWKPFLRNLEALTGARMVELLQGQPEDWRGYADRVIAHI